TVVIAKRCQDGSIGGKRNPGERRSIRTKPADQFRREMLRVGGAAAISEEENFAAAAQAMGDSLCRLRDAVFVLVEEFRFHAKTLADELIDELRCLFHES